MNRTERIQLEDDYPEVVAIINASRFLLLRRNELKLAEDLHVGQAGGIFDFGDQGKRQYDAALESERNAALDLRDALNRFWGSQLPSKIERVAQLIAPSHPFQKNEVIL